MGKIETKLNNRRMSQEYEKRNMRGFESDEIMTERVRKFIKDNSINLIIELGTYLGGTTRRLAMMCKEVSTVEINFEYFTRAEKNLELCKNVTMFFGDSVSILPELLDIHKDKRIFIFVDSHWEANNPLLAELEIIKHSGLKPIIAIHDFKVPGHPELGFDVYKDIVYEWDWIQPSIEKIYGVDGYMKEYNEQATGAMRGIVYISPK